MAEMDNPVNRFVHKYFGRWCGNMGAVILKKTGGGYMTIYDQVYRTRENKIDKWRFVKNPYLSANVSDKFLYGNTFFGAADEVKNIIPINFELEFDKDGKILSAAGEPVHQNVLSWSNVVAEADRQRYSQENDFWTRALPIGGMVACVFIMLLFAYLAVTHMVDTASGTANKIASMPNNYKVSGAEPIEPSDTEVKSARDSKPVG